MNRPDHHGPDVSPHPCVVILAGGNGLRWQAPVKQQQADGIEQDATLTVTNKLLVDIGGRPLLWRTIDLLAAAGIANPVVYGNLDGLPETVRSFQPKEPPAEIIETFSSCIELWTEADTVLFLLGDVVWSKAAIAQLLTATRLAWQFFGKLGGNVFSGKTWPEIYAVRFRASASPALISAAAQLSTQDVWRKKLWELYRVMLGLPVPLQLPDLGYIFYPPASDHFCVVPDWTDDVDDLDEYLRLTRFLSNNPNALLGKPLRTEVGCDG